MTQLYEYVVLRVTPDTIRGEVVNVGIALFPSDGAASVRVSAPLAKLRALDAGWNAARVAAFRAQIEEILATSHSTSQKIRMLASLGFCQEAEAGFFYAKPSELASELREIDIRYVDPLGEPRRTGPRSKLHREMVTRFRSMDLLGSSVDDLAKHRVVPHVPVPNYPDLKSDFVYKNGVYRITQTLDYRVASRGAHQKISEACTKTMAANLAADAWGDNTLKFALVCVPPEVAPIADGHLDMLYAAGFEIFHADDPKDLSRYHAAAFSH